jgi:hypothetical protein
VWFGQVKECKGLLMKKGMQDRYRSNNNFMQKSHYNNLNRKNKSYGRFKVYLGEQVGNAKIIKAPNQITIYNIGKNKGVCLYTETINFIESIKNSIKKSNCIVDFGHTEHITAAAMIVMFSQVQQAYDKSTYSLKIGSSKKSTGVNKILRRSGLKRLADSKEMIDNFKNVKQLPIIKGTGYKQGDDIVDYIQTKIYSNMSPETEYRIGDAISETMNNVGRHAYPESDNSDRNWWLITEVIGNQLYLAIYDNGIGIPKTVVEKPWFIQSLQATYPEMYKKIKSKLGEAGKDLQLFTFNPLKDSELISMSMKGDVTGTKEMKHGQGSKSIKALVKNTNGGKLWVYSNTGLYKLENENKKPELCSLPRSINGTLIQWNIEIQ